MAPNTVTLNSFPAQPPIISSEQISRYAELSALVSNLEAQQKTLRSELLELQKVGAEQETDCPYLLAFIDQERRSVDWKTNALELAAEVYGIEKAAAWKLEVEASAPVQAITQIRIKPNPVYAAGLGKPPASVRTPQTPSSRAALRRSGE